ncbi:MAG: peptidoglycan editing factor PgeF [Clostridia bacterium]|nr:peptidoglycan editing factor PgeF [Clostridia bacterium]
MQKRTDYNGVTYFYSEGLYPIRHGFSTRLGGLSKSEHTKSLNLGFYRGDKDIIVQKNIERFCEALDVDPHRLVVMPQTHSTDVRVVGAAEGGHAIYTPATFSCDALVTDEAGTALGVRVADCVPILMADPGARVIAAVHAGWRGTVGNIVGKTIEKMCFLGAAPEDIRVAIGPHISMQRYEVGEDVARAVLDAVGKEHLTLGHLRPGSEEGKFLCGLGAVNVTLLLRAGIRAEHIDLSDECTYANAELFYSHRRMGEKRGSMMGVISL